MRKMLTLQYSYVPVTQRMLRMLVSFSSSQCPKSQSHTPSRERATTAGHAVCFQNKLWPARRNWLSPFLYYPVCILMAFQYIDAGCFPTLKRSGEKQYQAQVTLEIPFHSPLPNSSYALWFHFPSGLSVLLLLSFHFKFSLSLSPLLIKQPDKLDFLT